jgi:serine/threonine-protein kinase
MVLGGRYRIIGLLGRGGMREVYRADDLKLGQPVALKFLPKGWGADPVRRERFYAEVRIARQVSHPHVCRVYDVAELDGRHS